MPIIALPEVSLYYEQHGEGPELLLVGGFSSDHTIWERVLPELTPHFHVTVFDNRGSGRSSTPDVPYTTKMMAADAAALLNALEIPQAYVAGHSMGAHIIQELLHHYPERVKKALLSGSKGFSAPTVAGMHFQFCIELMKYDLPQELMVKSWMPFMFGKDFLCQPGNIEWWVERELNNPNVQSELGYLHQMNALRTHDSRAYLASIKKPVLSMGMAEDLMVPSENAKFLADNIPGAQFEMITGSGHMVQFEKPACFCKALLDFFR